MVTVWLTRSRRRGTLAGWLYEVRWALGRRVEGSKRVGADRAAAIRATRRVNVALNAWEVRYSFWSRSAADRRAAMRQLAVDAIEGRGPADPATRPAETWREFADEDLAALGAVRAAGTVEVTRRALRLFQDASDCQTAIEVDVAMVQRFIQARLDGGASAATIDRDARALRAVWNRAGRRGRVAQNPFALADRPRVVAREVRVVTAPEEAAILAACEGVAWRPGLDLFVRFILDTGLRLGEALHLRWEHVGLPAGSVRVVARDEASGWVQKTGQARTVTVGPEVAARLVVWNRTHAGEFVFGDAGARDGAVRKRWRHAFRAAVSGATVQGQAIRAATIHDLRRTCLTRLALGGMPMAVLQRWAGHTSPTTTARYYIGIADADMARSARAARIRLAEPRTEEGEQ